MDEVFEFLATHVILILFFGLIILIIRVVAVYTLIVSKNKNVTWNLSVIATNFLKTFTFEDITKSKSSRRKTLKKICNYTKYVLYIWLILLALGLFFNYAENRNSDEFVPSNNTAPIPSN